MENMNFNQYWIKEKVLFYFFFLKAKTKAVFSDEINFRKSFKQKPNVIGSQLWLL